MRSHWFLRAKKVCIVFVIAIASICQLLFMSQTGGVMTANAAGLPDHIVNGNFEYPGCPRQWDDIYFDVLGGRWYSTSTTPNSWNTLAGFNKDTFGWRSTQPATSDSFYVPASTVQINYDNITHNAFAELSIHTESTIYQDIATTPGALYKWSLKECSYDSTFTDIISVAIGSTTSQTAQPAWRTTVNGNGDAAGYVGTAFGTKIATNDDGSGIYHNYSTQWETYTGSYLVPAGQTVTRFGFMAVNCKSASNGANLDDISFQISYPLYYNLTGGSSGSIYSDPTTNNYQGYHVANETFGLTSAVPTRSGFTFLGWSKTRINDIYDWNTYNSVKGNIITSITMPASSQTVYAVWGHNPTVTFVDGHSGQTMKTQTVSFGGSATAPTVNSYYGYTYVGYWSNSYTNVYSDVTTVANYTPNYYQLDINATVDGVAMYSGYPANFYINGVQYDSDYCTSHQYLTYLPFGNVIPDSGYKYISGFP